MHICIYKYVHTYIYIHTYMYIHVYIYMYIYICTCIHIIIYTLCMHKYTCIHACMHTYAHAVTYMDTYIIHGYIHKYVHTYMHTHFAGAGGVQPNDAPELASHIAACGRSIRLAAWTMAPRAGFEIQANKVLNI